MNKKLSDLHAGERGIILFFENNDLHLKLMEMGCIPGEEVLIEHTAPLGDPISILVSGYQLSLRLEEAKNIVVSQIKQL